MFSAHCRLATVFIFLLCGLFPARVVSQTHFDYRTSEAPTLHAAPQTFPQNCAPRFVGPLASAHFAIESDARFSAYAWTEGWTRAAASTAACAGTLPDSPSDGPLPLINSMPSNLPARAAILPPVDPASSQLASLGKLGLPLARARSEVLAILVSDNACTEWFAAKDPAPSDTFRSLTFSIDRHGQENVLESDSKNALRYYRQPYVARATQDGGANTGITVNANGAFYREQGTVQKLREDGFPFRTDGTRLLTVGAYMGSTLEAQMVTLLHEFGHVIDLLPEDADNLDGKSVRNTDEVLRHCRPEIEARSKFVRQSAKR